MDRHRAGLAARRRRRLRPSRVDRRRGARDACWRYERWIDEPRLGAGGSIANPGHPVLADAQKAIAAKYGARFDGFGFAYYRNSRDSVAMHRDREMRWLDDTVVAILTLGAQRPFLVQRAQHPRPVHGARPLPRGRRPDGVRRSLPGRLAPRRTEDAARGTRPDLRAVALHVEAGPARHAARLLRSPASSRGGRADEHPRRAGRVCATSPRDRRRSRTCSPSPTTRARTRSRSRPRIGEGTITLRRRQRAAARTRRPGRTCRCCGRPASPATIRSSSTAARRSTARRADRARTGGAAPPRARRRLRLRAGERCGSAAVT